MLQRQYAFTTIAVTARTSPLTPSIFRSTVRSHASTPAGAAELMMFTNGRDDLHSKRILSLAGAAVGAVHAGCLGVHAIGRGLAAVEGRSDKHAIKQVDRLLSNDKLDLVAVQRLWVRWVVGQRKRLIVNMDWTDFDADGQEMIVLSLQTDHGRSTPLVWLTVRETELKGNHSADRTIRPRVPR